MIHCVLHDPADSVAVVVVEGVTAGTTLTGLILDEDRTITLPCVQDIPLGHKVALKDMAVGDTVIKYGVDIGKRGAADRQGAARPRPQHQDEAVVIHGEDDTFRGYRRENGRVGVRNHVDHPAGRRPRPTPHARRWPTTSRARWRFRTRTAACSSAPTSTCISAR